MNNFSALITVRPSDQGLLDLLNEWLVFGSETETILSACQAKIQQGVG